MMQRRARLTMGSVGVVEGLREGTSGATVFVFERVRNRRGGSKKNRHSPVHGKKRASRVTQEGEVDDGVGRSGRRFQGGNVR